MSKVAKLSPLSGKTTAEPAAITLSGISNLLVVYLVWGSTYLAIRVAVREESGFPPFTMAGLRVLTGGFLLLLWAAAVRRRMKPSKRDVVILAISGMLLWVGGNGLVTWAEQRAHSGYAALLVAVAPMWAALLEAILDRKLPSRLSVGSLIIGFGGIVLLSYPALVSGVRADLWSVVALLLAGLSWATGTIVQSRHPVELTSRVSSGYQQIFAGLGFALIALLFGEPRPTPVFEAWLAWGYLVLFGSVFAFTAFLQALRLLPTNVVMTYAYVNPVIAVALGWLILGEPITLWTVGGAALVLIGVAGVFRARYARNSP
jgi:drug/metabolite transporter (DMT)-like permease